MDEPQISAQATTSVSEDAEYLEQCIAEHENRYEEYCEALLCRHLNSVRYIDLDAVSADGYGPDPFKFRTVSIHD
jgi:hypothetical protein